MLRGIRRALAMLLALLLAASLMGGALAEDWRDLLRGAFGLSDDYAAEAPDEAPDQPGGPITDPQEIVDYLDRYGELPDNFITKNEARALGWDSSYNYVGDVAPGKSIGGDRFGNYEGLLPERKGRQWYECDTGYKGKKRGPTRLLYSSPGRPARGAQGTVGAARLLRRKPGRAERLPGRAPGEGAGGHT